MSYKAELKARYRQNTRRMAQLMANGRSMTTREREEFANLKQDCDSLDNKIASLRYEKTDTRGMISADSAEDKAFTRYLRNGDTSAMRETRADGTGFTAAPNDAGVSAGTTGYFGGYMVPQGFWHNLQVARKYSGIVWLPTGRTASTRTNADALTGLPNTYGCPEAVRRDR